MQKTAGAKLFLHIGGSILRKYFKYEFGRFPILISQLTWASQLTACVKCCIPVPGDTDWVSHGLFGISWSVVVQIFNWQSFCFRAWTTIFVMRHKVLLLVVWNWGHISAFCQNISMGNIERGLKTHVRERISLAEKQATIKGARNPTQWKSPMQNDSFALCIFLVILC